jgi:arabinogalactan oligomer/maltooligosaccharide transport system substrate-binding protein
MYCFAQDQISRLVQGGALAPLGSQAAQTVTDNNDAGSVNAATVGDKIYAYPMTSDNGYYLYYDSSKISDEEAKTLEGIVAACQREGVKFGYNLTNAWIMAGFFFSQPVGGGTPLCTSTWTYSEDGKNAIAVNDNFNSANGLVAMREMTELANSGVWVDSADNFAGTGAIVTGIWNASAAEGEYGDNMKAVKLPTFVGSDGQTYQMGSFSGYKLIGCKPQEDVTKGKLCSDLALYLTSGDAQLERYYEFQWGPSNLEAQANEYVQANTSLAALLQQNVFAQPQGVIHGEWWAEAALLGTKCAEANLTEADLLAALATYEEKINAMIVK